jgi:hypothetical protein
MENHKVLNIYRWMLIGPLRLKEGAVCYETGNREAFGFWSNPKGPCVSMKEICSISEGNEDPHKWCQFFTLEGAYIAIAGMTAQQAPGSCDCLQGEVL